MIAINNLSYCYPRMSSAAIGDANATIGTGIHLLLGENGAGKTTLLHLIAGLLTPTEGRIKIDGESPSMRTPGLMSKIFFMGEEDVIPTTTIRELVDTHARFFPDFSIELLNDALNLFGLTGNETFRSLSLGNRRKSLLAYAFSLRTKVLLLDEPANGLDITAKQVLQQLFASYITEEQTVIISTHTTSDFEYLFDGVIAISRGRLLMSIPTWQLSEHLSFTSNLLPPPQPLYIEQRFGLFRAIIPTEGEADGKVDFTLLYNALLSPARENIINYINDQTSEQ